MEHTTCLWAKRLAVLSCVFTLFGCASLRNGGGAESLPVRSEDRVQIDKTLTTDGSMATLLAASLSAEGRNSFIRARLVAIDSRYYDFVTGLRVERQAADAGTQLLQIGLGVAGVATSATRTKTNLAAAAATLAGVKAVIDKEYYFDKTVPALVAIMNAKRLAVLVAIRLSMNQSAESYSAQDVIADLDKYERMGQLAEAVAAVEVLAKAAEEKTQDKIRSIVPADPVAIDLKRKLNVPLAKLRSPDNENKNRAFIDTIIPLLGGTANTNIGYEQAFDAMWSAFREASPEQLQALKNKLVELNLLQLQ